MEQYFNITYEFDKSAVLARIERQVALSAPAYICVADGVILNTSHRVASYRKVINDSLFCVCDSNYVPLYLRWLYGIRRQQYCGSELFKDVIGLKKYRMLFMGTSRNTLKGLQKNLTKMDQRVAEMTFYELPYRNVEEFDYSAIAQLIEEDGPDIVWVALGAPKQEYFMNLLKPHLKRGVMIAVGAAFKFYSGTAEKRAPKWMVKHRMEFLFRLFSDPRKQAGRCAQIVCTLPRLLLTEWKRSKKTPQ